MLVPVLFAHPLHTGDGTPEGRTAVLPAGSQVTSFWTPDLGLVLTWQAGALPASDVRFDVSPVDPLGLELPSGLEAAGFAYEVAVSPANWVVDGGVSVQLQSVHRQEGVLQSVDGGRSWRRLGSSALLLGGNGLVVPVRPSAGSRVDVTALVAYVGGPLILLAWIVMRRRRRKRS